MRAPIIAAFAVLAAASTSHGVITHGTELERPENAWIGLFRGGSAVAIGEHYLLTAAHVGGGSRDVVNVNGDRFITRSVTAHPEADIALIEVNRSLPGWHEITTDVSRNERLVFGGFGLVEERENRRGYRWSNQRGEVWGENLLDYTFNDYGVFDFDRRGRDTLESEAIFTPGDSGTGVFVQDEEHGTLDLAGIAVGITGRYGRSRFGSLGFFHTLGETLDFFNLDLTPFVPDELAFGVSGPVQGPAPVPAPGAFALFGVSGVIAARRRR